MRNWKSQSNASITTFLSSLGFLLTRYTFWKCELLCFCCCSCPSHLFRFWAPYALMVNLWTVASAWPNPTRSSPSSCTRRPTAPLQSYVRSPVAPTLSCVRRPKSFKRVRTSALVDVCSASQLHLYLYLLLLCLGAVTQVSAGFCWAFRTPLWCCSTSKLAYRLVSTAPCSLLYWSGTLMEAWL